jgi:hypothetical protein
MQSREELEKRVGQLERQIGGMQRGGMVALRGVRKRASWGIGDIPFYDIAVGPDLEKGEFRGHARGIIAIGDMATGVLALGGLARGVIAVGGLAAGLFTVGGLSIGLLSAIGGLAIGSLALGGGAVGGVALGGGAAGYYACGGGAVGKHVIAPFHRDREAQAFFREYGLGGLCSW